MDDHEHGAVYGLQLREERAGGNFGVVTAMEFEAFPVIRFYGGIWFRGEDAAEVLNVWRTWLPTMDEELTSSVAVQRLSGTPDLPDPLRGAFVLQLRVGYLGTAQRDEELIAPIRASAVPLLDTVAERPFEQMDAIHLDPQDALPYAEGSLELGEFSAATLAAFLEPTGPDSDCPLAGVELRALGGALDREPAIPNPVPSRGLPFVTFGLGVGGPQETAPMQDCLKRYVHGLSPWASDHNMGNFLSPEEGLAPTDVRRLFGTERYDRLAAVKRRHDPSNLFRVNHNIAPV